MAYELTAAVRQESNPRALRREGQVPGVVYGPELHHEVSFERRALEGILGRLTRSSRIVLELDGETISTFIREIQYHPITDEVIHVDLYNPPAGEPISLEVPIHLTGEAIGRKSGGIVNQFREVVEVHGPAELIPELIQLDISNLDIHDTLHVSDLSLPEGTELLTPMEATLVSILAPRKIEEVAPVEGELEGEAALEEGEAEAGEGEEAEEDESEDEA